MLERGDGKLGPTVRSQPALQSTLFCLAAATLAAATATLMSGCGRLGFDELDAGTDDGGGFDVPLDVPVDAPLDASVDASLDAGACLRVTDVCAELPFLSAAPMIDGTLEPCLGLSPLMPVSWTEPGQPITGATRVAAAWRADGLYLYAEVDDAALHPPTPPMEDAYCGDAFEVYVDDDGSFATPPTYDMPGTSQLIVAAPPDEASSSTYSQRFVYSSGTAPWPTPRFVMRGRPGGYALEMFVSASDLGRAAWTLTAGQRVGLNLSTNVSTPDGLSTADGRDCGSRLGQYFLESVPDATGCGGLPFCDVGAFCRPTLLPP